MTIHKLAIDLQCDVFGRVRSIATDAESAVLALWKTIRVGIRRDEVVALSEGHFRQQQKSGASRSWMAIVGTPEYDIVSMNIRENSFQ